MGTTQTIERSVSVVILGAFNPAIFQPAWLDQEGLLAAGVAEQANVQVLHPEIASFSTDWFRLQVQRERFSISTTSDAHTEPLRDLALGLMTLLRHTPTRVVGINTTEIVEFEDRDSFDGFGFRVSPPKIWDGVLDRPGLVAIQERGTRDDGHDGHVQIKVEPILDGSRRVGVEVNDHYSFSRENRSSSTAAIVALLEAGWDDATKRGRALLEAVRSVGE